MGYPSLEQQIFLKIEEGQPEEAVNLARQQLRNQPGTIEQLANALVAAGSGELAVKLLTELMADKAYSGYYLKWLVKYYRQDHPEVALEWQRRDFEHCPALRSFQELRLLGEQLGAWPDVRSEAVEIAGRNKNAGLLVEIALDEGDVARALELLPQVAPARSYRREVAEAAEAKYPREAIKLYQEMAETAIAEKQRKGYAYAARLLRRMKELHERLGDSAGWTTNYSALKNRYANLPALQDELRKAAL